MGVQINPLWQTQLIPLLFLLTAVVIGYGVVLFESCVASSAYRRRIETHLLEPMAKIMLGMLAVFVAVRFGDLLMRDAFRLALEASAVALAFWIETLCFLLPFVLVGTQAARRNPARLFLAGVAIMLGGVFMRLNAFLIGYDTGVGVDPGWSYFPSVPELMVTIGMFAVEVLGYIIITRRFPVLPREDAPAGN
jgi:Ni/Fe-hydrogenase subunit HybB-like protein